MKTKPPFDGEIHAVSAKTMPDLNSPKREPGWFLGETTPTRDEAVLNPRALEALENNQRQLDMDGVEVGVSRQALDELLSAYKILASAPAPASGRVDAVAEQPDSAPAFNTSEAYMFDPAEDEPTTVRESARVGRGKKCEETAPAEAEPVAALAIVRMFKERIERHGNWDEGCFYYGNTSASELQEPLRLATAALAKPASEPAGGDVREAAQFVYDKFVKDREQGYVTRDKTFAIDILGRALSSSAGPAVEAVMQYRWRAVGSYWSGWFDCPPPCDGDDIDIETRTLYAHPAPATVEMRDAAELLAHLKRIPMVEWVWSDAEWIFRVLAALAPATEGRKG